MGKPAVHTGATAKCSFGVAPSVINAVSAPTVIIEGTPAATIMDMSPMVNILPFGTCMSLSNPTVAAATAAALGVLTPMPCVPNIVGPWVPGSPTTLIAGKPALVEGCECVCAWGGVVEIVMPGTTRTME